MSSFDVVSLKVRRGIFKNYTYLGLDRAAGVSFLVDPAWERETIEAAVRESRTRCEFILITHAHPDHVDLADELAVRHGIPVYMAKAEIERYGFRCTNLRPLEETDRLAIGSGVIEPISTPGHTHAGMCFLFEGHLFSGDTLFSEGCGMCVGDGADPAVLFRSIQKLKTKVARDTRIFPGHSYGQEPGQPLSRLMTFNIYLQFEREADFVAYRMRGGQAGWAGFH